MVIGDNGNEAWSASVQWQINGGEWADIPTSAFSSDKATGRIQGDASAQQTLIGRYWCFGAGEKEKEGQRQDIR